MKFWTKLLSPLPLCGLLVLFSNCSHHSEPPKTGNNSSASNPTEPSTMSPHPSAPSTNPTSPTTPATPTVPGTSNSPTPAESGPDLKILVPEGHAPNWLIEAAQIKIGGKIEVTTYSNEAEFRTIFAKPENKFDLIGISDRLVPELIKNGALENWPPVLNDELPHCQALYLHHYFDEENAYTYPYGCSLLGYSYPASTPALKVAKASTENSNKSNQPAPISVLPGPKGWKDLNKVLLPQISLPDDPALKTALEKYFPEAGETSSESKTVTLTNVTIDFISRLKTHPPLAAPTTPATGATAISSTPTVPDKNIIVLPVEGTLIAIYSWAIVKDTPHLEAAENYLRVACAPENAARLATENYFRVTQTAAFKALAADVSSDPVLYPPDEKENRKRNPLLDHSEFIRSKL